MEMPKHMTIKNWMNGIRGAALMILLWVIGWGLGFGGIMELVDPDGKIQDVWPTLLAIPGLIGGVIFAALLLVAERSSSFNTIPLLRFALWGMATGIILGLLSIPAEVGDVSPGAAGMIALGAPLGFVSGIGCGIFCRLVSRWSTKGVQA